MTERLDESTLQAALGGDLADRERVRLLTRLLGDAVCRRLGIYELPAGFRLSVVIPVFNEVETVADVVRQVRACGVPCEIVLVDDGSEDGTRDLLDQWRGADDLNIVTKQARQIEGILTEQERFANIAPVTETIVVDDVLDEAAHIIPKRAMRGIEVELSGELSRVRVHAHRIGLLQVMGNLILNAYESIKRCKKTDGLIFVDAAEEVIDDTPMVRVTIRHNGSGFNKDTGEKIFRRGFTSKNEGRTTGLGLHWCANAVAGMGGRIQAESRGLGQGAEFHVLLPTAQGGGSCIP